LLHAEALAEHGGLEGTRDEGLLESALARPRNLCAYEGTTDLSRLAAEYAIGIARNHPFSDGNKRTSFIALALFLALNGLRLKADQVEAVRVIVDVASGAIGEEELARWVAGHAVPGT
jgi:death-on-curing protein